MTGNRFVDVIIYLILAVIAIYVLFIVLDKLDEESDEAFFDPHVMEVVG